MRKLIEKSNWYKFKQNNKEQEVMDVMQEGEPRERCRKPGGIRKHPGEQVQQPSSIMFVPRTAGGRLLTQLRKVEEDLSKVTNKKVMLIEETGMKLRNMLCTSDPWEGDPCGRESCTTCTVEWEKAGS